MTAEEKERNKQYWSQFKAAASGSRDHPDSDDAASLGDGEGWESSEPESDVAVDPKDERGDDVGAIAPRNLFGNEPQSEVGPCTTQTSESEDSDSEDTLALSPNPKPFRKSKSPMPSVKMEVETWTYPTSSSAPTKDILISRFVLSVYLKSGHGFLDS